MTELRKEAEIAQIIISNLRSAEAAMNHMGVIREDAAWIKAAGLIAQVRDRIQGLTTQRAAPSRRMILQ